jgi:hypothetical protein
VCVQAENIPRDFLKVVTTTPFQGLNFTNIKQICISMSGTQTQNMIFSRGKDISRLILTSVLFLRTTQPRNQWKIRVCFLGVKAAGAWRQNTRLYLAHYSNAMNYTSTQACAFIAYTRKILPLPLPLCQVYSVAGKTILFPFPSTWGNPDMDMST